MKLSQNYIPRKKNSGKAVTKVKSEPDGDALLLSLCLFILQRRPQTSNDKIF